jgi:hypothetical protein
VVPRVLCIFYGVYIEKFMFALLLVVEIKICLDISILAKSNMDWRG